MMDFYSVKIRQSSLTIKVFYAGLHAQRSLSKKTVTTFLMKNFDHVNWPLKEWVSEWLLLNANSSICIQVLFNNFSAISWREQANYQWNDDEVRFVLEWILIALVNWYISPRVDMSPHFDILFWFRTNQSLLFILIAACLAEKQQIPILRSLVWPDLGSNTRYTTLEASTLTNTPHMWLAFNGNNS